MPYLSPPTLTRPEQDALLQETSRHPRDHLLFSLALGTGLRLSEITGLNVGDLFTLQGKPRSRMRLRREIAKGGRAGDVFLPDSARHTLSEGAECPGSPTATSTANCLHAKVAWVCFGESLRRVEV